MTDEEKKAIESLKNISIYMGDNYTFSQQGIRNLRENLRIVLPVIETQSKEIEELKKYKEGYKLLSYSLDNYTSKDKIKVKIEEIDKEEKEKLKGTKGQDRYAIKQEYMYKISVLQSLLEKEQ